MKISAYIPCFNNQETIAEAIASVQKQSYPVEEIIMVDDRSKDASVDRVGQLGIRVIRHECNLGRGAVRARAMNEATHELVLCCDATNVLAPNFLENALPWFEEPRVAAVFGRVSQLPAKNTVERWRGRHLFNLSKPAEIRRGALLATFGAVVRRSAVMEVGNYQPSLRHTEDGDLGAKLLKAGYDVVYDPGLTVTSIAKNTLFQVLERHWRWQAGIEEKAYWSEYLRKISYSMKVMAREDLQDGDPLSLAITLFSPHYQFWKSRLRKRQNLRIRT